MLAGLLSPSRRVMTYRIAKLRDRHPDWFRDDLSELIRLLREGQLHPVVAERIPLTDASRTRGSGEDDLQGQGRLGAMTGSPTIARPLFRIGVCA